MAGEADIYVPGFVSNLQLVPQQTDSRLYHAVMAEMGYTGAGTLFNADDVLDDEDEEDVEERAPPTPESFGEKRRRVGFFKASSKQRWIEDLDVARQMQDPTNTVMAGMMATKNRATDRRIIRAFTEPAREGQNGENSVNFPAANIIGVADRKFLHDAENVPASGNLPLTIGKIINAKVRLDKSEVKGPRFFGCTADQIGNLLASTPTTSKDYGKLEALNEGTIDKFMGFTFIRTELFPLSGNIRTNVAWCKEAVNYKERPVKNARIGERADRSYRMQAYYEVERGAARRYDNGVVHVLCDESIG
ncbi:MAG: hypothetical protein DI570_09195 [Phenylobacterium zucineum]|nr:MAG: hypothetical protein DI570_09195 [Phenylobacterium zucineum]